MGYFSNGSEGADYKARWCRKCIHSNDCPVWDVHLLHNYDECNNKNSILHYLIPRSKDGLGNEKCKMFIDEGYFSDLQKQHFHQNSENQS